MSVQWHFSEIFFLFFFSPPGFHQVRWSRGEEAQIHNLEGTTYLRKYCRLNNQWLSKLSKEDLWCLGLLWRAERECRLNSRFHISIGISFNAAIQMWHFNLHCLQRKGSNYHQALMWHFRLIFDVSQVSTTREVVPDKTHPDKRCLFATISWIIHLIFSDTLFCSIIGLPLTAWVS